MAEAWQRAHASSFLDVVFGGVGGDHHILIWTLPDRRSSWYTANDSGRAAAAEQSVRASEHGDVYIGVALADRDRGTGRRLTVGDACGITALWADVDVRDPAHRKPNLPPDEEAAMDVLAEALPEPSVLVQSGHGLQAWWVLAEPWIFEDDEEQRALAAVLAERWQGQLRSVAARYGWTIDATHDLSRVMRIPGTLNHKSDPPKPVLHADGLGETVYTVDELREHVGAPDKTEARVHHFLGTGGAQETDPIVAREDPQIPMDRWEALRSMDPRVERCLHADGRPDLNDQSASALDLSLASFAAQAEWSDQEIADLIVYRRQQAGQEPEKPFRHKTYLARTIIRARQQAAQHQAADRLDEAVSTYSEVAEIAQATDDVGQGAVESSRTEVLAALGEALGIEVLDVIKYPQDPPLYEFRLAGEVRVPPIASRELFRHDRMLEVFFDYADGHVIPSMKREDWRRIVSHIGHVARVEETGEESTEIGSFTSLLHEYLTENTPERGRDEITVKRRRPYISEEGIVVFPTALSSWLTSSRGERSMGRRLHSLLRSIGADQHKVSLRIDSQRTSRQVWVLPRGEFPPPEEGEEDR